MRSVVLRPSIRCERCQLPLRWCLCPVHQEVSVPVAIDVVMHAREQFRPSSTGSLIRRIVPGSRQHVWLKEHPVPCEQVRLPEREMWVLHPHGGPMPSDAKPEQVQLVLLDGAWKDATTMAQDVSRWGRLVNLPMSGESRYWLRAQVDEGRFCTAEALMFVLSHLGLHDPAATLRLQFELHVYAHLRARGQKDSALAFRATSPIRTAFAEFLAQLDVPRPR